jgi:hypothetical protein
MTSIALLIMVVVLQTGASPDSTRRPQFTLVEEGKPITVIVIPTAPSPHELKAATELQTYIKKMSGALLPVVADAAPERTNEILLGHTKRSKRFLPGLDEARLEEDGFRMAARGSKLVIYGGTRKGTLYGVYTLLEDLLGCRMYSPAVTIVPERTTVTIPSIDTTIIPFFRFRQVHYLNGFDRAYSDWHKLHSGDDQREEWGMWVHTFEPLVPSARHFATHPEYFTLQGGRRLATAQLCLSNPDVFNVLTTALRERMARQPLAHTWSVSQNDNLNECRCDSCTALNTRYGGSSGTMVAFVNRVARTFPDHTISTLAYNYTRSAPTNIRPDPNVNIMLCSIECNRSKPIGTDPENASFKKDIEDWGKLTGNIMMWDYVVQFRNLLDPFPNLRVLQPNIQLFAKNNIRQMFQQGAGHNVAEFSDLRTYLIAKLLWNPDCDINAVLDDFLAGYYGPAAPHIRRYIDTMHDALERSGKGLGIYGYPFDAINSYLTPELLRTYSAQFDEAEAAVKDAPAFLDRVRIARLPVEFAILDISLHDATPELSYFDRKDGKIVPRAAMRERLERFVSLANHAGIQRLDEMGRPPDEYRQAVEAHMRVSVDGNLAYGKPVTLLTKHSEKYPVGGARALTDGIHGAGDYHCNWLGFEAEHVDAVIDLGAPTTFSSVATNFYQEIYSWTWLPQSVSIAVSNDGKEYTPAGSITCAVPETEGGVVRKEFRIDGPARTARYIRLTAQSRLTCPGWHIGAGKPSWLFIDEIVVR